MFSFGLVYRLSIWYHAGVQIQIPLDVIHMMWLEIRLIYMTSSGLLLAIFSLVVRLLAWIIKDLYTVHTRLDLWLQTIVANIF